MQVMQEQLPAQRAIVNQRPNGELTMHLDKRLAYWRANLRLVAICLAIWFLCSYGFGVHLVEQMNAIRIGGFRLGFWFAQQGSIYTFVVLIFVYVRWMNRLDEEFGVSEE